MRRVVKTRALARSTQQDPRPLLYQLKSKNGRLELGYSSRSARTRHRIGDKPAQGSTHKETQRLMARYGFEPGDRGSLRVDEASDGVMHAYFVPRETPTTGTPAADRLAAGVKLLKADPNASMLTIYPTDTRPWSDDFLGPKYRNLTTISLPLEPYPHWEARDILEDLPSGFTKDYEYGLGFARECDVLVDFIEKNTACTHIEFVGTGDPTVVNSTFQISFVKFDALRGELVRIKNRGDNGIRRVTKAYVHNDLADALNLEKVGLTLGRLPITKWMTSVAAGGEPLTEDEQDGLLTATSKNAGAIASRNPASMKRLQRDIEVVNLDQLIASYAKALAASHHEAWWQQFFEENVFALQLLFGGPTAFIDAQVPIGEGSNSVKGKKIADYLLKNSLTNNACLVEIKKPSTKLLKSRPYREGVYGVQSEIGEAITQVLDQALQLTRHEADTKTKVVNQTWRSNAPRCFVVAGRLAELDSDDRRKSFDLYREHLSGVQLVAYDEILEQLKTLRQFLASDPST